MICIDTSIMVLSANYALQVSEVRIEQWMRPRSKNLEVRDLSPKLDRRLLYFSFFICQKGVDLKKTTQFGSLIYL